MVNLVRSWSVLVANTGRAAIERAHACQLWSLPTFQEGLPSRKGMRHLPNSDLTQSFPKCQRAGTVSVKQLKEGMRRYRVLQSKMAGVVLEPSGPKKFTIHWARGLRRHPTWSDESVITVWTWKE